MKSNRNDIEGRSSAPCSPSSLTPETNEAWKAVSRTPDGMYDSRVPISAFAYAMSRHSKKMELERNAAIAALTVIEERYVDGCDTYEDWKFMGDTARAFLSENSIIDRHPSHSQPNYPTSQAKP